MPKQKTGPAGPDASPKARNIASQDATADDGSLDTVPGATSHGVVDGIAGTGGSSGTGADKANVKASGEVSGITGIDQDDSDDPEADVGRGPAEGSRGIGAAERSGMRSNIAHPNRQASDDTDVNDKGRGKSGVHG